MPPERKEKEVVAHTPLGRAQKRLAYWKEILDRRMSVVSTDKCGTISISVQSDTAIELELIEKAEAAVRDWENIVRAVSIHEEMRDQLLEMACAFHDNGRHPGSVFDCGSDVCEQNMEIMVVGYFQNEYNAFIRKSIDRWRGKYFNHSESPPGPEPY